jgi:hypothetical protein
MEYLFGSCGQDQSEQLNCSYQASNKMVNLYLFLCIIHPQSEVETRHLILTFNFVVNDQILHTLSRTCDLIACLTDSQKLISIPEPIYLR